MLAETVASNRIEMADLSSFEEYNDRRQQPGSKGEGEGEKKNVICSYLYVCVNRRIFTRV